MRFIVIFTAPLRGSLRRHLEQLLLAHAKAEQGRDASKRAEAAARRAAWSSQLAALLEGHA